MANLLERVLFAMRERERNRFSIEDIYKQFIQHIKGDTRNLLFSYIKAQRELKEALYNDTTQLNVPEKQILLHYLEKCQGCDDEQMFANVLLLTKSLQSSVLNMFTDDSLIDSHFSQTYIDYIMSIR